MRAIKLLLIPGIALAAGGCTNTDDPQLAMCQAVAKQLTSNSIASWEKIDQSDRSRNRLVQIAYSTADDQSGSIDCIFPILDDGSVKTSPNKVALNGQSVGTKELLTAGVKASAELLKGTAANTVERSRELAGEAGKMVNDVAGKARDAAVDTSKALQQKLEE
ncbi:MAG: hypothetical protein V3U76_11655 [Granulosicoccus sp.]